MPKPVIVIPGRLPEGRIDELTGDEVTISATRSLREEKSKPMSAYPSDLLDRKEDCVFCPGNEDKTCEDLGVVWTERGLWECRVFSNLYPTFILEAEGDLVPENTALGACEVIVETRLHNGYFSRLSDAEISRAITLVIDRYFALKGDPRLDWVTLFKNYGREAGSSIEHPHLQLVAKAKVPRIFRNNFARAQDYRWRRRSNLCCDYIKNHRLQIIMESAHFVALVPYAAKVPYHIRLFPKKHNPSFAYVLRDDAVRYDFVRALKQIIFLFKMAVQGEEHERFSDPAYNFFIDTAPYRDDHKDGLTHWYLEFEGRTTVRAGYEFHTGEYINPTYPEEIAKRLREVATKL